MNIALATQSFLTWPVRGEGDPTQALARQAIDSLDGRIFNTVKRAKVFYSGQVTGGHLVVLIAGANPGDDRVLFLLKLRGSDQWDVVADRAAPPPNTNELIAQWPMEDRYQLAVIASPVATDADVVLTNNRVKSVNLVDGALVSLITRPAVSVGVLVHKSPVAKEGLEGMVPHA